ncbi:MAG: Rv0361 family membrane protein [Mycobacterium sp.]
MANPFGLDDGERKPSFAPIVSAFAIFVVVVIAIVVFSMNRGDGLSEDQRVARAAVAQNDALQRGSYPDFRAFTCAALHGTEAEVLTQQRDSVAKKGARYVDDVTSVAIVGETATATVIYHFDSAADTEIETPMTFAQQDGQWQVCSPGPV